MTDTAGPVCGGVLMTMAEAFEQRRGEVDESAASVMDAIEQNETFAEGTKNPGAELVAKLAAALLAQFDPRFGGFGSQPKFPIRARSIC